MARMVRKQVYLDPRQDELLKAAAARTGKTESALIREAIDDAFDIDAVRLDRQAALDRWTKDTEEFARRIAEMGGIEPWTRDGLYEERLRKQSKKL